ncbi:MAG: response regulator transcription factor [Ignavibacteria bacterium]|nr:response regulator transcription factor [Ignavibacteria bacterium]
MLNILIADDHPIFRAGIKNYINREPDLKVIYEAENGTEAFNYLIDNDVYFVVIDIGLSGRSGLDMLPDIKMVGLVL